MTVFDASALLAYLRGEPGSRAVREQLEAGGVCGAANWPEAAQKVRASGADWGLARSLLLSFDVTIEPVTEADAEHAATLWRQGSGLSLGDRLCLSLAARLGVTTLTADTQWRGMPGVTLIR